MTERELSGSPSMLELYARAGAAMIPGASRLPFVAGSGREVPDLSLVRKEVTADRDRLAGYDRVCGFSLGERLPVTYPHVLAFAMQLALMTNGSFPFAAIGLLHTANRITQHRPIGTGEQISLRVWATPIESHPRGRQVSLRTEVRVADELVWEEVSSYLRRGTGERTSSRPEREQVAVGELPATATWKLRGDLGRRYGSVSGDLNPIHIHPLSARLFGFPSAIAHGMWTKARCLAALESQLPGALSVSVSFRKPIRLPATVQFVEAVDSSGRLAFGVRDAVEGTAHLEGTLAPLGA
ncbi:MAG: hypothetical protein JO169_03505 [Solirubrobacterales bacterium]|nr:hypothetical protein [Solirubrobacterales bacterium]MBV9838012.1 hypothetical protein [Solirubrobacterales bacterium]